MENEYFLGKSVDYCGELFMINRMFVHQGFSSSVDLAEYADPELIEMVNEISRKMEENLKAGIYDPEESNRLKERFLELWREKTTSELIVLSKDSVILPPKQNKS